MNEGAPADTQPHSPDEFKYGELPVATGPNGGGQVTLAPGVGLATADFCSVAWLGRDLDLSFFAVAPAYSVLSGFSENAAGPSEMDIATAYLQTARIRMGPAAAGHLVLNLMFNLGDSDRAQFDGLVRQIAEMAEVVQRK